MRRPAGRGVEQRKRTSRQWQPPSTFDHAASDRRAPARRGQSARGELDRLGRAQRQPLVAAAWSACGERCRARHLRTALRQARTTFCRPGRHRTRSAHLRAADAGGRAPCGPRRWKGRGRRCGRSGRLRSRRKSAAERPARQRRTAAWPGKRRSGHEEQVCFMVAFPFLNATDQIVRRNSVPKSNVFVLSFCKIAERRRRDGR